MRNVHDERARVVRLCLIGNAGWQVPCIEVDRVAEYDQLDCRNPDEIYVAEITAWRVQKILLRPQQAPTSAAK